MALVALVKVILQVMDCVSPDGRGLDFPGKAGTAQGFGHVLHLRHLDLGRAQKVFPLPVHAVGDCLLRTTHGLSVS